MDIIIANLDPGHKYMTSKLLEKRITTLHFPTGLGIVAACLKKAKKDFKVYDSYVDGSTKGFLNTIAKEQPDIVLISGYLGNFGYAFIKDVARGIKAAAKDALIIIGGPITASIPDLLISNTRVDFVVVGEGEITIIELLDAIEKKANPSQVKGLCLRGLSGEAFFTGRRKRINDLDNLSPFPMYDSFNIRAYIDYLQETGRCWEIVTSRGCSHRCRFCKLTFGGKLTFYSCETVIGHMDHVFEKYGIDRFSFVDDNFLNSRNRASAFLDRLENSPRRFKWRFQGRADAISLRMVERMLKVGLFDISFGIESASQKMLSAYGKGLNIKRAADNLAAISGMLDIHASFVIGGPGENWSTIKETARFIRKLKLRRSVIYILTLFPGTALYDEGVQDGLIKDEEEYCMNLGPIYDRPYVNMSELSDRDLLKARDLLVETAAEFGPYFSESQLSST
ncbi:MAG: B12-binding domain-containing radical SAM protein [Candidatus Omnitrophica bacterium]|nr:B12-binding domain-containing radical SAM protein [Candidatus Omnitrophota bacterium]